MKKHKIRETNGNVFMCYPSSCLSMGGYTYSAVHVRFYDERSEIKVMLPTIFLYLLKTSLQPKKRSKNLKSKN